MQPVTVGPTVDRSVVGIMVDFAKAVPYYLARDAWDETTLDRWLTNPSALVPGTKMFFKLDNPRDRADVIAYLKELR